MTGRGLETENPFTTEDTEGTEEPRGKPEAHNSVVSLFQIFPSATRIWKSIPHIICR